MSLADISVLGVKSLDVLVGGLRLVVRNFLVHELSVLALEK